MAKQIKGLSRTTRQAKKAATNNIAKETKPNSPKGRRAREDAKIKAERKQSPRNRTALRAVKKTAGPNVKRERKAVYPGFLFAEKTIRQVKHLKKRPEQIEALRKEIADKLLANQTAEKKQIDALRAAKARAKARAAKKAV